MCDVFKGRLPSEIVAELERVPVGFLEEVVEAMAYESAYRFYKAQPDTKDRSELVQLAKVHTFELAKEAIEAKKKKATPKRR